MKLVANVISSFTR